MVKVGHLQFSKAPGCLFNVTRAEVLLEQENYLFDQVLDWPQAPAYPPNIVQADQPVLHVQQGVGPAEGLAGHLGENLALKEQSYIMLTIYMDGANI